MPFLRFSRDKRGYENIYLVHTQSRRGKAPRQRILYWYRTPPGVRVGRPPFDEEARRRIEAQNPELTFDWPAIVATPIPPPAENEQWRERRRAERAAKQAQRAEEDAASRNEQETAAELATAIEHESPLASTDDTPESLPVTDDVPETAMVSSEPQRGDQDDVTTEILPEASQASVAAAPEGGPTDHAARRRRRRGGRRRRGRGRPGSVIEASEPTPLRETSNPVEPPVRETESNEPFSDSDPGDFDANDE